MLTAGISVSRLINRETNQIKSWFVPLNERKCSFFSSRRVVCGSARGVRTIFPAFLSRGLFGGIQENTPSNTGFLRFAAGASEIVIRIRSNRQGACEIVVLIRRNRQGASELVVLIRRNRQGASAIAIRIMYAMRASLSQSVQSQEPTAIETRFDYPNACAEAGRTLLFVNKSQHYLPLKGTNSRLFLFRLFINKT